MNPTSFTPYLSTVFYISPLIILAVTAIFVLLLDVFLAQKDKKLILGISFAGLLAAAFSSAQLWNTGTFFLFNEAIRMDKFSIFFTLLSIGLTFLTILHSQTFIKTRNIPLGEYLFLLLSCCMGMSLMAWSTDLITLFMSLEIMSLAVYILTGIERDRVTSSEGALKYFLLGAFSTGFLLYGITLIYACVGSSQFSAISNYLVSAKFTIPILFYIGVGLLIVGLGFKIGAVPFHMWVPDVYEGAPTTITAFMATGIKAASFAALIRLFLVTLSSIKVEWNVLILGLAIATMTVGNIGALLQGNLKRMLAYSSIAHAGYILIAACAATESQTFELATSSILFYLIAYGLMTMGAFAVIIYASQVEDKNTLNDYAGYGFRHPYLGLVMTIFMLSLIGVPPTAGFIGKFYIFSSALKSHLFGLAIIGIINSIIASYYYLRVIVVFYMKKEDSQTATLAPRSLFLNTALAITSLGSICFGLCPTPLFKVIAKSVASLF